MPSCHFGAVFRHLTGNEASWYAPMTSCARRHLFFDGYFPNKVQTICKNDDMTRGPGRAESLSIGWRVQRRAAPSNPRRRCLDREESQLGWKEMTKSYVFAGEIPASEAGRATS